MLGRAAATAVLAALPLAAATSAYAADDAKRLALALGKDPVHVDAAVRSRLSAAAAGQVRLRIVRRDIGRIRIGVISKKVERRAGGLEPLSNAIAARLQRPGSLVLVSGHNWWLNTSFAPARVVAALQRAVNSRKGLRRQLLAAVDRIAAADPGPAADPADGGGSVPATGVAPPTSVTAPPIEIPGARQVAEGAKTALILVGAALLAAVLAAVAWLSMRSLRARRAASEALTDVVADARSDHVAVGEALTDLDLDEEMPNASAAGKDAYARALDLYDRAGTALDRANNPRRARRATELVAAARAECDRARALLTQESPEARR